VALTLLILGGGGTVQATETTTYVLTDVQGTVLAREDAQGTTIATYDYRPYGKQQAGPVTAGPGYTGHVNDLETGLVYMQQRYYDPLAGRFLSVDPVGPAAGKLFGFNRYNYVNNNPISHIDPTGTTCTKTGQNSTYECKVDENLGKFSKTDISTINKAYTLSVNSLQSHSNRSVIITVDGKSMTAKAGDVAKQLIAATVKTQPGGGNTRASTLGGGLTPGYGNNGHATTTIYKHALETNRRGGTYDPTSDLPLTFIHEGIHMLPSDSAMTPLYRLDAKKFSADHQAPYNEASSELYEPEIW
jgi:RHS repeat-associated protein